MMKLTYPQLGMHLQKTLSPLYLLSGDEPFLKQEARALIRKAAKHAGFYEHIRLKTEGNMDWDQLYSLFYTNSLLSEKRLLELNIKDIAPTKTIGEFLTEYAKRLLEDPTQFANHLVLIDVGKRDDKMAKTAWYIALEKVATTINIWPISLEQFPQWILERAKKYKLPFTLDAAKLLTTYVEGNLLAAAQTLEKIYLLKPEETIHAEFLKTILVDESRFTIFELVDYVMNADTKRALTILEHLKKEGVEPSLILWAITRELRLIIELMKALNTGQTYEALFKKYRIFAKRQSNIRNILARLNLKDCYSYLQKAADIDLMIKGAKEGSVWDNLQLFCLRMV